MQKTKNMSLGRTQPLLPVALKKNKFKELKKSWQLYLFVLPAFISIFVFAYIPMYGVVMAFQNFRQSLGFLHSPWVGFAHFSQQRPEL